MTRNTADDWLTAGRSADPITIPSGRLTNSLMTAIVIVIIGLTKACERVPLSRTLLIISSSTFISERGSGTNQWWQWLSCMNKVVWFTSRFHSCDIPPWNTQLCIVSDIQIDHPYMCETAAHPRPQSLLVLSVVSTRQVTSSRSEHWIFCINQFSYKLIHYLFKAKWTLSTPLTCSWFYPHTINTLPAFSEVAPSIGLVCEYPVTTSSPRFSVFRRSVLTMTDIKLNQTPSPEVKCSSSRSCERLLHSVS